MKVMATIDINDAESGVRLDATSADGTAADVHAVPVPARPTTGSASSLASELAALATLSYAALHQLWRRHYRALPPKKISRDILELGIAWKIQEDRLGGLSGRDKRQIVELAKTMEQKADLAKPRTVAPKPGARLFRTWAGITHEVVATDDGFAWSGKRWGSLSVIAREITGTRWSGPRFFGLTAAGNKMIDSSVTEEECHAE
jgi:hypothetical protein